MNAKVKRSRCTCSCTSHRYRQDQSRMEFNTIFTTIYCHHHNALRCTKQRCPLIFSWLLLVLITAFIFTVTLSLKALTMVKIFVPLTGWIKFLAKDLCWRVWQLAANKACFLENWLFKFFKMTTMFCLRVGHLLKGAGHIWLNLGQTNWSNPNNNTDVTGGTEDRMHDG